MSKLNYHIYSHADADGGVAAAIFKKFLSDKYLALGWNIDVIPVNHGSAEGEWRNREIHWPCSILDFTLHPLFLDQRFFNRKDFLKKNKLKEVDLPPCYWLDHHPTGASYSFLNAENASLILKEVITKWDVSAISTPGLMRTHRSFLQLPDELLADYEDYIDVAEIIDGALYSTPESAHDFSTFPIQMQTLFNSSHPAVDRTAVYKRLVDYIAINPNLEDLFDSDPLYPALIEYERTLYNRQLRAYSRVTKKIGSVAFANFMSEEGYEGLGRFIPYLLFPDAHYAIHILPKGRDSATISCGINPWNKPSRDEKHLGRYFANHFQGGGHAFVAGGRVGDGESGKIDELLDFINS